MREEENIVQSSTISGPARSAPLLFLVGARASGKTTIGEALARQLAWSFIDTDQHMRQSLGRSVAQVVETEGWPGFRARESAALRQVAEATHGGQGLGRGVVIATGGGMVLAPENRSYMRRTGLVFYLCAPAEALAARLEAQPLAEQRPSLTGGDIVEEMCRVLAQRESFYQEAAHHVLDATAPPEAVLAQAVALLSRHKGFCPDA